MHSAFGVTQLIGAELEFYIRGSEIVISDFLNETKKLNLKIDKEKGKDQYECILEHTPHPLKIADNIVRIKNIIITLAQALSLKVFFDAKPYNGDYGSAMHLHLSLHEASKNVFSSSSYDENVWLQHSIGGLLDIASESVYQLCTSEKDFDRFVPNFMAPTTISWGGNNRSTIIRIPDSKSENRRIEYRLANANSCPYALITVVLIGVYHGLQNKITPPKRVFGLANDIQYNLKTLPKTLDEAKQTFYERGYLLQYLKEFAT